MCYACILLELLDLDVLQVNTRLYNSSRYEYIRMHSLKKKLKKFWSVFLSNILWVYVKKVKIYIAKYQGSFLNRWRKKITKLLENEASRPGQSGQLYFNWTKVNFQIWWMLKMDTSILYSITKIAFQITIILNLSRSVLNPLQRLSCNE